MFPFHMHLSGLQQILSHILVAAISLILPVPCSGGEKAEFREVQCFSCSCRAIDGGTVSHDMVPGRSDGQASVPSVPPYSPTVGHGIFLATSDQ